MHFPTVTLALAGVVAAVPAADFHFGGGFGHGGFGSGGFGQGGSGGFGGHGGFRQGGSGSSASSSAVAASSTGASTSGSSTSGSSSSGSSSTGGSATGSGSTTASTGGSSSSGGGGATLDSNVICTGCEKNGIGLNGSVAGQAASLTSNENFINFCGGKDGGPSNLPITNGIQITTGSCNVVPMGVIAATTNMPSSKFIFPKNLDTIQANTNFTVQMSIQHLTAGNFVNPDTNYYAAPCTTDGNGDIIGHSHFVIQAIDSLQTTSIPDPGKFDFFKGVNTAAENGVLSEVVAGGLEPGTYRLASINACANHQPVLVAVAQHGSLDDQVYFTVSASSTNTNGNGDGQSSSSGSTGSTSGSSGSSGQSGSTGSSSSGGFGSGSQTGSSSGSSSGGFGSGSQTGSTGGSSSGGFGSGSQTGSSSSGSSSSGGFGSGSSSGSGSTTPVTGGSTSSGSSGSSSGFGSGSSSGSSSSGSSSSGSSSTCHSKRMARLAKRRLDLERTA